MVARTSRTSRFNTFQHQVVGGKQLQPIAGPTPPLTPLSVSFRGGTRLVAAPRLRSLHSRVLRDARASAGIIAKSDELIHLNRLRLTLQRGRPQGSDVGDVPDELIRARSDDHAPHRRIRLKPSGEVRRVAYRREVADVRSPDVANEGWAAVDANAKLRPSSGIRQG